MRDSLIRAGQLLSQPGVQDELDLSSDQEAELQTALGEMRRKVSREIEDVLGKILTEVQYKRFHEIGIQTRGVSAFSDADIRAELELTDEQRDRIREIVQNGFKGAREDRESLIRRQEATAEKARAVLSDEQKSRWEQMKGRPFDLRKTEAE